MTTKHRYYIQSCLEEGFSWEIWDADRLVACVAETDNSQIDDEVARKLLAALQGRRPEVLWPASCHTLDVYIYAITGDN